MIDVTYALAIYLSGAITGPYVWRQINTFFSKLIKKFK